MIFFRFTEENIQCKQALVSSSCGKDAGQFAFGVAKMADRKHAAKCSIQMSEKLHGMLRIVHLGAWQCQIS